MSDNRMKSYEGIYTRIEHNNIVKNKIKVRVNKRLAALILELDLIQTHNTFKILNSI